jgi:sarcosine oxidase
MRTCDAAIVGLGVSGAAITRELARRGWRVTAFDRHAPPHSLGSSHGHSRIIRAAYFEDPLYVPLVLRAFELWTQLEALSGTALFKSTGVLNIGPPDCELLRGTLASVQTHGLPHEYLDAAALRACFPAFTPPQECVALLERRGGMLAAESCVSALLQDAERHGAEIHCHETVHEWTAGTDGVRVRTTGGTTHCGSLVIAAGPWLPELLGAEWTGPRLEVERQVIALFSPRDAHAHTSADECPIALWEYEPGRWFYTLPDAGQGVKAAFHHEGGITDPHSVERSVSDDEVATIRAHLASFLPAAAGELRETSVCLYTNSPDGHFLIDAHPQAAHTFIVSACSGHGFKFAPAIAESFADWLETGRRPAGLEPFSSARFR